MKAVLLKGPKDIVIDEIPVPEISDDEVLVEVKYCGICGSDISSYKTATHYHRGTYMGHEYSGVVAKVGKNVKGLKAGDRVAGNPMYICGECWACKHGRLSLCEHGVERATGGAPGREYAGAFAKFIRVPIPEKRLHLLPDEVSFEEGAMVELLAVGLHSVRVSAFRVRDDTMVLGAGPIGLGLIAFLKNAGPSLLIVTEIVAERAAMAKRLGADYVFNPLKEPNLKEKVIELTKGKGVDVLFECSATPEALDTAPNFIRRGAQIMVVSCTTKPAQILPQDVSYFEWEYKGTLCYYADEFPMVIEFLRQGVAPLREMVTKKIKLTDIVKDGFEVLVSPEGNNQIKILVEPEE